MSKGITGVISEMHRGSGELSLEWRIPGFRNLSEEGFNYYNSPCFWFSDALWHLEVFPNWESSGVVSLYLWRDDSRGSSVRTVDVSVGVRECCGSSIRWKRGKKWEMKEDASFWLGVLCPRLEMCEHVHRLRQRYILTIVCQVKTPCTTATEVTNDDENEISEDEINEGEISEDGISEDEISEDEISEDEISEDEISEDEMEISEAYTLQRSQHHSRLSEFPASGRERVSCNKGITGVISKIRRSRGELFLQWKIPRFPDLSEEGFNYYNSPRFCFSDALWHLEVFPNWESSGQVSLFLWKDEDRGTCARSVDVSVGVRGCREEIRWRREKKWEMKGDASFWLGVLCPRQQLCDDGLMQRNILTIVCQVKIPGTTVTEVTNDDEDGDSEDEGNEDKADGSASKRRKKSENKNTQKRQQPSDECNICCEGTVDCALNPCGHMCWCYNCALRFWEEDSPRCPICRISIQNILKIYRQ